MEPLFKVGEKVQAKCRDGKVRLAKVHSVEIRKPFTGRDISGPNKDKTLIYYKVDYITDDGYDCFKTLNFHPEQELTKI